MLVLARLAGESIQIGDDIVVKVLTVENDGSVRLGIAAPVEQRVERIGNRSGKGRPGP